MESKEKMEQAAREYADEKSKHRFVCTSEKIKANAEKDFIAGAGWQAHNLPSVSKCVEKAHELDSSVNSDSFTFTESELLQLINMAQGR